MDGFFFFLFFWWQSVGYSRISITGIIDNQLTLSVKILEFHITNTIYYILHTSLSLSLSQIEIERDRVR